MDWNAEQERLKSGTVELRSGEWMWSGWTRRTGTVLNLSHRTRHQDRMVSWTEQPPTAEAVREAARHPASRTWEDADGIRWELSMRVPPQRGEGMSLSFACGTTHLLVPVAAEFELGDATHAELRELLRRAQQLN